MTPEFRSAPVPVTLCSGSPARLATLRAAGIEPRVIVSGFDESAVSAATPAATAQALAAGKVRAVHERLHADQGAADRILIGCDSILDLAGTAYGKPGTAEVARQRWRLMRGRTGTLVTGHQIIRCEAGGACQEAGRTAATAVHFGTPSEAEIDAYIATGEPLQVAGAFTLDGLGGPFVERIEGDPHNVVGISLPLLRTLLTELGVWWPDLWAVPRSGTLG